jgi:hypothetical protein
LRRTRRLLAKLGKLYLSAIDDGLRVDVARLSMGRAAALVGLVPARHAVRWRWQAEGLA